ncbi:MAG TPA: methylmalonyl-CoA mutase family protein [Pseudolabrys sp.]|nr:methylmalonyl-CoA mutase family protein [Pseudolabrys sp.]
MTDELSFAAEFPQTTEAEWRELVQAALKGAPFERLVSRTYDGIAVQPLYPRAAAARPVAGRPAVPWQLLQRVDDPRPDATNRQALEDLNDGAAGLSLVFAGSVGAYGYGLDGSAETLARALEGIYLDAGFALDLDMSAQHDGAGHNLAALIKRSGTKPSSTNIRFGYDPLGTMARSGNTPLPWQQIAAVLTETVSDLRDQGFAGPFAVADGRSVHAAGGSEAQELAFVTANAVEYLRVLTRGKIALDDARQYVWFRLAADADEFLTIAKFRAFRKIWARVEEASGLIPMPAFLSAETAWRMMSARDPYVNMLRATIAVCAAGIGGADAISAMPFTNAIGLPDAFARRIARNMQLILLEESNLYRVADPAAGSGGLEALTNEIARAAWALFQEIESAGGAAAAIEQGLLQKKVAATRAERTNAVAHRKDALTGVSDYPDLAQRPVKVLNVDAVSAPSAAAQVRFEQLPQIRLAEPFETLRDASDRMLAKSGRRPIIFLATLGKLSEFTARATFAKNFYEAGGIEAVTHDGFRDLAELIGAFKASGARLACLCSSDQVYARDAAEAAGALVRSGAIVHQAGKPGENEKKLALAGVKAFIYAGCDALAILRSVHDILEIK